MQITLYLAIMLTLSTIIALLSLLLMVLERRPQGRHAAAEQPPELDPLSPRTSARAMAWPAVQRAIRSRRSEARRRLDARRRKIVLGGLSLSDAPEDEHSRDREVFQDWEPTAAASGPTSG